MVECPECGAGADMTKDGTYAHCASCMPPTYPCATLPRMMPCCLLNFAATCALLIFIGNNIFEPGKEGSSEKGSGSSSGDKDNSESQAQTKESTTGNEQSK